MAITATLSVDRAAIPSTLACRFSLLIANSIATPVNILDISPADAANDAFAPLAALDTAQDARAPLAMGQVAFAPAGGVSGQTKQVPGNGNITLNWATMFAASPQQGIASRTYPAAVVVRTDDGSITLSNTVTITVTPVTVN